MLNRPIQTSLPAAAPKPTLDDPALKAAVQQVWGHHRASDRLRAAIERRLREETAKQNPTR